MNNKASRSSIERLATNPMTKIARLPAKNKRRRIMDNNSGLTTAPDRRIKNSDRRSLDVMNFSAPVRRYAIDRRININDRRSFCNTLQGTTD